MKIIYNNILPFPGFSAIMLFGVIFARKDYKPLSTRTIRHEEIHKTQARDMGGYLMFYLRYFALWIRYGYKNHPCELEARYGETKPDYLSLRKKGDWKKYK